MHVIANAFFTSALLTVCDIIIVHKSLQSDSRYAYLCCSMQAFLFCPHFGSQFTNFSFLLLYTGISNKSDHYELKRYCIYMYMIKLHCMHYTGTCMHVKYSN